MNLVGLDAASKTVGLYKGCGSIPPPSAKQLYKYLVMKKLIEIKNSNIRTLRINYDLGNTCNYKCWYCFPDANTGTVYWPDVDVVKKNVVKLINYYLDNNIVDEVQISLVGGEPTLWKELGEFARYVKENATCKLYLITNGSRTIRWWKEYADYFDSINISIHHEQVNLDHIEDLAKVLYKKNLCFFTDVLMDHKEWNKCQSIVNRLCSSGTKFMVLAKPIHINGETFYSDEQRLYLQTHLKRKPALKTILKYWKTFNSIAKIEATFDNGEVVKTTNEHYFIVNMLHNFQGWQCNLGINFLFIDRLGNLSGTCKQRLYGLDGYYNINDIEFAEKFNPKIKPVVCEQRLCLCSAETALTKKRT